MRCTVVPDIMRHRYIPGAIQYDATNRGFRLACPCGCGNTWSAGFPLHRWRMEKADHARPTIEEKIELCFEIGGKLELHWSGRLTDGEWLPDAPANAIVSELNP